MNNPKTPAPSDDQVKDAGFRPEKLRIAAEVIADECERGSFPGAVCFAGRGGKIALLEACGSLSPTESKPVTTDSIFDMASVTKPMTAALMALLLAEEGKLSFLQSVQEFFPERRLPQLDQVTLRMLITHTSGIPAWVDLYSSTENAEQALDLLLQTPLSSRPGTRHEYSCLGYITLGTICQRVAGETIDSFLKKRVWKPLGMDSTRYNPDPSLHPRIASTKNCPARDFELIGQVHDGNAWRLGGISGNAGLFSCATDIFRYIDAIIRPDASDPVLSRMATLKYLTNQIDPQIGSQSYGFFTWGNDMLPAGDFFPSDSFGHTGFTGTSVLASTSEQVVAVLLTNRVCSDSDGSQIRRARRRFHNAVASAII